MQVHRTLPLLALPVKMLTLPMKKFRAMLTSEMAMMTPVLLPPGPLMSLTAVPPSLRMRVPSAVGDVGGALLLIVMWATRNVFPRVSSPLTRVTFPPAATELLTQTSFPRVARITQRAPLTML